jgi:hypothetical protein
MMINFINVDNGSEKKTKTEVKEIQVNLNDGDIQEPSENQSVRNCSQDPGGFLVGSSIFLLLSFIPASLQLQSQALCSPVMP